VPRSRACARGEAWGRHDRGRRRAGFP